MTFVIRMKGDTAELDAALDKVSAELTKAELKGAALGSTIGKAMRQGSSSADQLKASAGNATDEIQRMTASMRGFDGLSAHLKREADVLERIRGPIREHNADIMALQTMYRRGAISAAEYRSEVDRMNAALRRTPAQGAGGGGSSTLGQVAGGLGLPVGAGPAALVAAGVGAAHEIGQLSDEYTNLQNRLRRLAPDQDHLNRLMEKTREVANASRSDWASTGETFVRLTNATKDMGLSQSRVLALTETISKAFSMSGASASEASAGMLQLSQAFSSGKLQGDEFRSLAEAVPDVLDLIAKQMGVSRGALKELGSEGKITSDVLVKAFEAAKSDIDSGFAKTVPTLSQQWTVFKNEVTAAVGKAVQDANLLPRITHALVELAGGLAKVASTLGTLASIGDKLEPVYKLLATDFRLPELSVDGAKNMLEDSAKWAMGPMGKLAESSGGGGWDAMVRAGGGGGGAEFWALQAQGISNAAQQLEYWQTRMDQMVQIVGEAAKKVGILYQALDPKTLLESAQTVETYVGALQRLTQDAADQGQAFGFARDRFSELSLDVTSWGSNPSNGLGAIADSARNIAGTFLSLADTAKGAFGVTIPTAIGDSLDALAQLNAAAASGGFADLSGVFTDLIGEGVSILAKGGGKLTRAKDPWGPRGAIGGHAPKKPTDWDNVLGVSAIIKARDELMKLNSAWEDYGTGVQLGGPTLVNQLLSAAGQDPWGESLETKLAELKRAQDLLEESRSREPGFWDQLKATGDNLAQRTGLTDPWDADKWDRARRKAETEAASDPAAGLTSGFHDFTDEAMNSALAVKKAFTTAFEGIEQALINFVDTGKLELGDLAKQLEHLLVSLLFRQAVGGIGSLFSSKAGKAAGGAAEAAAEGASDGASARMAPGGGPSTINVMVSEQMVAGVMTSDRGQSAITNVVYKQHGQVLAVRERLRSRG